MILKIFFMCGNRNDRMKKNRQIRKNLPGFRDVFEKVDYPRKDNSNYPYSFFSNLLPLLISAIGKLNKINILFENHRVFGVFTMWEN